MECSLTVTRAGVAGWECECLITHHSAIRYIRIGHGLHRIQSLTVSSIRKRNTEKAPIQNIGHIVITFNVHVLEAYICPRCTKT